ncbi:MAG: hypothetical protein NZM35_04530 [Chitinophagales bacterium]|nr:hypothetical protein [Chitinophagales bacterium]MDW8418502.1 hypothetical protein [Chitinophagales bacterium]
MRIVAFMGLAVLMLVSTSMLFGQAPPPPPPPGPGVVPIDGGVIALLLGGLAYGIKKLSGKTETTK